MLVLTRKSDEAIRIGQDVVIRVLRVAGDRIRIGIDAPKDVRIVRDELPDRDEKAPRRPAA